ncbi:MBL fold metallo-hydrolase [Halalkalibacter nanhaiisediminis]|uniref:Glyoxylase-like metal-dependent hydrolase (Beta-lactamase superfamily II) n=1 Tax=Halalkalibacter nanhaiisediminis TaxID=688079 RepID=A0A562QQI3_9BACI|nr:MBL fold metallo-hydrolase [Halalkalibacter nanhaiisediminis]TWI58933.1 glyoxylase-like metal-dependent hydrolase (beta-lactamase superfamily II) [Halalkalibacter nanhaiisediminis]
MAAIKTISPRISLIDGYDLGMDDRTGTYVLHEEEYTLIESGPSPSVDHVLKGLESLKIDPADIKYLIVTHIHLDHAGGAGLLLTHCPNAKMIVHRRGARHLIDPSRLIAGAKAIYGDQFDRLFDPILPIPEERIIIKDNLDTLQIGKECKLTFYDTPGHAAHHFSIYDPISNGIFTGDTIGVRYEPLTLDGYDEFVLPSTSPNQFDPEAMLNSLNQIEALGVEKIYFSHFNTSTNPANVYAHIRKWLPLFMDVGTSIHQKEGTHEDLADQLFLLVLEELDRVGVDRGHRVYEHIKVDISVSAMGIFDYLSKRK